MTITRDTRVRNNKHNYFVQVLLMAHDIKTSAQKIQRLGTQFHEVNHTSQTEAK